MKRCKVGSQDDFRGVPRQSFRCFILDASDLRTLLCSFVREPECDLYPSALPAIQHQTPGLFSPSRWGEVMRKGRRDSVFCMEQRSADMRLIQCRGFPELPPPDQPRPKKGLWKVGQPYSPTPHANMISSCAPYIHEILIYNTLIGIQQGSLARADQSWVLSGPPPWPWRSPLHVWHNHRGWNRAILVIAIHLDSAKLRRGE